MRNTSILQNQHNTNTNTNAINDTNINIKIQIQLKQSTTHKHDNKIPQSHVVNWNKDDYRCKYKYRYKLQQSTTQGLGKHNQWNSAVNGCFAAWVASMFNIILNWWWKYKYKYKLEYKYSTNTNTVIAINHIITGAGLSMVVLLLGQPLCTTSSTTDNGKKGHSVLLFCCLYSVGEGEFLFGQCPFQLRFLRGCSF